MRGDPHLIPSYLTIGTLAPMDSRTPHLTAERWALRCDVDGQELRPVEAFVHIATTGDGIQGVLVPVSSLEPDTGPLSPNTHRLLWQPRQQAVDVGEESQDDWHPSPDPDSASEQVKPP